MGRIAISLALALLTVLGFSQPADAANQWRKLHRPLHLPQLAAGEACPVSAVNRRVEWESVNIGAESGIGRGPVYPGLGSSGGHLVTRGPSPDGWFGNKVFWYVKPGYRKRVLIRGRRLDGPGKVRFHDDEVRRPRELRIRRSTTVSWEGKPRGSRGVPSSVSIRASGCYGVQIDGTRFSRTVVFTASTP